MARQTARRQSGRKPAAKSQPGRKTTAKSQAGRKATPKGQATPKPTAKAELKRKTEAKGRAPARPATKRAAPRRPAARRGAPRKPAPSPRVRREPEPEGQPFTAPVLGATFGSMVIVVVVAILNTSLGRDLERHLDAPARTLIAGPVIVLATVVVIASLVALVPAYRRDGLRVAEVTGWLIPSWLVMCGMGIAAISWALSHS